ncbi:WAS/WASL-interacting protein family member 1-like [Suncus etruscus]|uniref:WAS/WASL-interacting protein family member 1-like n=1 Tax=Suncus etruscus TaxID=109475 RepID=UPI002110486C|nr:WAS/WASL-interacting protein family member 1-like [Suncus etruscus]
MPSPPPRAPHAAHPPARRPPIRGSAAGSARSLARSPAPGVRAGRGGGLGGRAGGRAGSSLAPRVAGKPPGDLNPPFCLRVHQAEEAPPGPPSSAPPNGKGACLRTTTPPVRHAHRATRKTRSAQRRAGRHGACPVAAGPPERLARSQSGFPPLWGGESDAGIRFGPGAAGPDRIGPNRTGPDRSAAPSPSPHSLPDDPGERRRRPPRAVWTPREAAGTRDGAAIFGDPGGLWDASRPPSATPRLPPLPRLPRLSAGSHLPPARPPPLEDPLPALRGRGWPRLGPRGPRALLLLSRGSPAQGGPVLRAFSS